MSYFSLVTSPFGSADENSNGLSRTYPIRSGSPRPASGRGAWGGVVKRVCFGRFRQLMD